MKTYSLNLGSDTVMNFVVTTTHPKLPTAENYRFDLLYNSKGRSGDGCEIQFWDKDKDDWGRLEGTPIDILLLSFINNEEEFNGKTFAYYTMLVENPVENVTTVIDVTPTQGEQDVPRITGEL